MSLELWKREKNFRGLEKGYARDPEGFPFKFLWDRLVHEAKIELWAAIEKGNREDIIKECADVSNLCDFIANKAIGYIPDKYDPKEVKG